MIAATRATLDAAGVDIDIDIGIVLVDAGYGSEDNATIVEPDRLIATLKGHKQRRGPAQFSVWRTIERTGFG
jgi:hypothetical protein